MASLLALQDPVCVTTGFDRPNLYFGVQTPHSKPLALLELLEARRDRCGIVYCATRKAVEEVEALLRDKGFSATRYHAGLSEAERRRNQEDFVFDRKSVMVATNAFGMGIDKSNVSFVIHYNMPKNIESYYQEAGRAGRDGSPADCILLYSPQDVRTNRFLIENSEPNPALDAETQEAVQKREYERLRQMTFYCTTDRLPARVHPAVFRRADGGILRQLLELRRGLRRGGRERPGAAGAFLCGADRPALRPQHDLRYPARQRERKDPARGARKAVHLRPDARQEGLGGAPPARRAARAGRAGPDRGAVPEPAARPGGARDPARRAEI